MSTVAQLVTSMAVALVLVRLVMWRLVWLDRRPVTARMKRGDRSGWPWLLVPAAVAAAGLWCLGHVELARWVVALSTGVPFLFATDRLWGRRQVTCPECGVLGRLTVEQAVEALQFHRDLFGHTGGVR